jgi:leucyl aminopeptidase
MFANRDDLAQEVQSAARDVEDPIWRMPLWDPYDEMLKSDIADVANASSSPMAGCITAAMFLKRFVPDEIGWVHFDTFAWRDAAKPGRPRGGDALGLRAMLAALENRYSRD